MRAEAIVLAAGKGERLWPLTSTRPKPLIPILCRPLLAYHLEGLSSAGVNETLLVLGYKEEMVEEFIRKEKYRGARVIHQGEPLGTGHAVSRALDKTSGDRVLVVYGDVFVPTRRYVETIKRLLESEENIMVGARVEDVSRYGLLQVDRKGYLKMIIEKPGEKSTEGLVNAGIMALNKEDLEEALEETRVSPRGEIELTDALTIISRRKMVKVIELGKGEWTDIGTPWDYLRVNRVVLEERCRETGLGEDKCIIRGEAVVRQPVVIEPPVFIDSGAEIGPFSHLRPYTIVCSDAKIGFSVQVKASVILEDARLPHLNYVGDSIVGEHANLGAGTITANLRHDGKTIKTVVKGRLVDTGLRKFGAVIGGYAKTGINTSIAPGVKIGAYSWIDSGCTVKKDVPDRRLLRCLSSTRLDEINREAG